METRNVDRDLKSITTYALISRVVVLCIQLVSNILIPDHEANAFNPPQVSTGYLTVADKITEFIIGGFKRWDAIYFQHVAEYGYTYENTLAFFPLFPFLIRLMANTVFLPLQLFMAYSSVLLVVAIIFNSWLFVKSAQMLYKIGVNIINEKTMAYKAAVLFCINPASVFMSAPYSETFYCFLLLKILQAWSDESVIRSCFYISLCTLCRSNGMVAILFPSHFIIKNTVNEFRISMKLRSPEDRKHILFHFPLLSSMRLVFVGLSTVLPFLIHQFYTYNLFCKSSSMNNITIAEHIVHYGREMNYHIIGDEPSVWCNQIIPISYSYVQKNHWNVGFLKYYSIRQIPNFLLASPVIVIGFSCCWTFYKLNKYTCLTLGLFKTTGKKKSDDVHQDLGFENTRLFISCAHLLFLLSFGVIFIHIQVLTRLIFSSCPVLYWYIAFLSSEKLQPVQTCNNLGIFTYKESLNKTQHEDYSGNLRSELLFFWKDNIYFKLSIIYFLSYFFLGTIAFSNFLPFT